MNEQEIEKLGKRILSNAIDGKLNGQDHKDWQTHGHLVMHWLRVKIEREAY